jgi:hypothetical protein
MPIRPPEIGFFETRLTSVRVGISKLIRLSGWPSSEPYWSRLARNRFDDSQPIRPGQFGLTYAGDSLRTAFAESIIHSGGSVTFSDGSHVVARTALTGRFKIGFTHDKRATLRLADLTGPALKRLGLNNDVSAGDDYTVTQQWARAIHDCDVRWDGIRYVSRQCNDSYAYAIFERSGLRAVDQGPLLGQELDRLCAYFHVVAI